MLPILKTLVLVDWSPPYCNFAPPTPATVPNLLAFLAPPPSPDAHTALICPLLRELHIRECRDLPREDVDLLDFARTRLDAYPVRDSILRRLGVA